MLALTVNRAAVCQKLDDPSTRVDWDDAVMHRARVKGHKRGRIDESFLDECVAKKIQKGSARSAAHAARDDPAKPRRSQLWPRLPRSRRNNATTQAST